MRLLIPGVIGLVTYGAAQASFADRADAALRELVKDGEPGIAVCAVADGAVTYRSARGLADIERAVPMTTSTPVYIASVAKAFTSVAIVQLVEQRKLSLDERLVERMPDLPAYLAPVTVRHLLTHTSGVPDPEPPFDDRPGMANADVMAFVRAQTALKFPAGSRWSYSNTGFVLLAELFAAVAGLPLSDHLTQNVFGPLGMSSTFVFTPATRHRARAIGYQQKKDGTWVRDDYDAYTVGPGGVYSSADDLCAWGMAFDAGKLVKRMTQIALFTPHVNNLAGPTPMGLGFQVEDIPKGPLAGAWYGAMFGSRDGFRAVDMKIKDRPFRYAQVSNSSRTLEPVLIPSLYFGK